MNPPLYCGCSSRSYCSWVRLRKTPPCPLAIAWSRVYRLAEYGSPPPRSISPISFSESANTGLRGRGVLRSGSRN